MSEKVQITIKNKVGEKYADLQTKIVTPSKETQVITPDDGYYGLKEVIVNPPEIDGETIIDKISNKLTETNQSINDLNNNLFDKWWAEDKINEIFNEYVAKYPNETITIYFFEATDCIVINTYGKQLRDNELLLLSGVDITSQYKEAFSGNRYLTIDIDRSKDIIIDFSHPKLQFLVGVSSVDMFYQNYSFSNTIVAYIGNNYFFGGAADSNVAKLKFVSIQYYGNTYLRFNSPIDSPSIEVLRLPRKNISFVSRKSFSINNLSKSSQDLFYANVIQSNMYFKDLDYTKLRSNYRYLVESFSRSISCFMENPVDFNLIENNTDIFSKCLKDILTNQTDNLNNCSFILRSSGINNFIFNISEPKINSFQISSCYKLKKLKTLDLKNGASLDIGYCINLEELVLLNIKTNLQVGSGSTWGHKLTLESLLGICQECIDTGSSKTLTVGTANLEKLKTIYVKKTNAPEEDESLPKIPMVQCESTDSGAMDIATYMALKNWKIA